MLAERNGVRWKKSCKGVLCGWSAGLTWTMRSRKMNTAGSTGGAREANGLEVKAQSRDLDEMLQKGEHVLRCPAALGTRARARSRIL